VRPLASFDSESDAGHRLEIESTCFFVSLLPCFLIYYVVLKRESQRLKQQLEIAQANFSKERQMLRASVSVRRDLAIVLQRS